VHAVLAWDGAGFHTAKALHVPHNVTLLTLPPRWEQCRRCRARCRPQRKPGSIFNDRAYATASTMVSAVVLGIFSFLAAALRRHPRHRAGGLPLRRGAGAGRLQPVPPIEMCYERTAGGFSFLYVNIH
jgi:hypothetical protein